MPDSAVTQNLIELEIDSDTCTLEQVKMVSWTMRQDPGYPIQTWKEELPHSIGKVSFRTL